MLAPATAPVTASLLRSLLCLLCLFGLLLSAPLATAAATADRAGKSGQISQTGQTGQAGQAGQTGQRAKPASQTPKTEKSKTEKGKSAQKPGKTASKPAPKSGATAGNVWPGQAGATVYDGEPPVTSGELGEFLELLPRFRAWAKDHPGEAHPLINNDKADFYFSDNAAQWVQGQNWQPRRFFCVMGRMAAAMVLVEEGNDMSGSRPRDMPPVSQEELDLARKNLGSLLRAGRDAPRSTKPVYPEPQQFAAPRHAKQ